MIHLLDEEKKEIGRFYTYSQVVDYIHKAQIYHLRYLIYRKNPSLESPLDLADTKWRFVYYKHGDLNTIYTSRKEPPPKGIEKQAFDRGLDLIEIHRNDLLNPLQIPVTVDLDIGALEKDWCLAYCKANGYTLTEESFPESGKGDEPCTLSPSKGGKNDSTF